MDGGPVMWHGYLENGKRGNVPGRYAEVHKTLVAASRIGRKGIMTILDGKGGVAIRKDSKIGQEIMQKIREVLRRNPDNEVFKLYVENGVYIFYMQDENYEWQRFTYDTGAAETVMSKAFVEKSSASGGPRPAQ